MRDIRNVIEEILTYIPKESASGFQEGLIRELNQLKEGGPFQAPEIITDLWVNLSNILVRYIGIPETEWQLKVAQIVEDRVPHEAAWGPPSAGEADLEYHPPEKKEDYEFQGFVEAATQRGFARVSFVDSNGKGCSIQDSSIATENRLWMGCNQNAKPHHVTGDNLSPRMHLTQAQAEAILPYLTRFAETGSIKSGDDGK